MFNIRLFQEQLKDDLNVFETKFLVRTFSYVSVLFFCFMLFLVAVLQFHQQVAYFLNSIVTASLFWLISTGLFIFFYFCYQEYSEYPMDTSKSSIVKSYSVLAGGYVFLALALLSTLWVDGAVAKLRFLVIFVFTFAAIVYSIPAIIAAILLKHKTSLALNQFLKYCCFLYVIILLIFMVIAWHAISIMYMFITFIIGVSVCCTPILSFYRLKMTSRYIDYTNPIVVYKWELFFVLQAMLQFLLMPIYITKLVSLFLEQKHKR